MVQKSQSPCKCGRLFVVATPIGNLEDLTFRAVKILGSVPVIACEDTRHTRKLLTRYNIKKKLIVSYFQPKEKEKISRIIFLLRQGKDVALVSDAGTPGLSDPGFPLIREAINQDISVIPVPGASAVTAALSASGLPTSKVLFLGFPPPKKESMKKWLCSVSNEKATLVFFLPARRITTFLQLVQQNLGERNMVIAREMTKIHEEFIRGLPEQILESIKDKPMKGEMTILISGI